MPLLYDGDPLNRKSVRSALKSLDNSHKLGDHPLACLNVAETRRRSAGYKDTLTGRGVALRHVLLDALESLRPVAGDPDHGDRRCRPYVILKEQYVNGRCPDYLARQMGIEESTYFREQGRALDLLADVIRRWELGCDVPDSLAPGASSTVRRGESPAEHHVPFLAPPRPPYDLVGRDTLLHDLKRRLFSHDSLAHSALTGLPGVGKTALAVELAHDPDVLAHFYDGVLWASLGRQPDVLATLGMWGMALGVHASEMSRHERIEDRAWVVHAAIGMRWMLLVIDDAWQAEEALAFRLGGPHCAHLLTTRISNIALEFAGEGMIKVNELSLNDGLVLLARLAPETVRARPRQAQALVQAVGGLPLALNLMGRYLREETHTGCSRRLHEAIDLLRTSEARLHLARPRAALERHSGLPPEASLSLLTVIGMSDEALSGAARRALWALSVFPPKPNSFSEEAALSVAEASAQVLHDLAGCGLLERSGPNRYILHQTITDYARANLADQAACERLVRYFVCYVETHEQDYDALGVETQNISAALQTAFDLGMQAELVRGVNAFCRFLGARGLRELAKTHLGRARHAAKALGDRMGLATALLNLGQVSSTHEQAEAYLLEALALAHSIGHQERTCAVLVELGAKAVEKGDYVYAETCLSEGLDLAREIEDAESICRSLVMLGSLAARQGDYARAEAFYQEGMALAREAGDDANICQLLLGLGTVAASRGEYAQAEAFYREGLDLARQIGHRSRIAVLLQGLGSVAAARGKQVEAESFYQEALILARQMGDRLRVAEILQSLGALADEQGDQARAEALYEEGLAVAREIEYRELVSLLLACLGAVATKCGKIAQAEAYLREGLDMARKVGCSWLIGDVLGKWGDFYLKQQRYDLAGAAFQEALEAAREQGMQEWIGAALYGLARVAAARGDMGEACHRGQQCLACFEAIGHRKAGEVAEWLSTLPAAH
jgi:tetratricopeptide (TPR) repeat protein